MARAQSPRTQPRLSGKLRIGNDWNAITIIALSQSNPLKAVAELVENSIDAGASNVTITRGREKGRHYLRVTDDGAGVPRNGEGIPDFRYVATHICDSIKRRLKAHGTTHIQGEFGIGLLSFWTVGEELTMTSAGDDGKTYQMRMRKGDPGYTVGEQRALFPAKGTDLKIAPLLQGIRQLSGEKMQWYLASELRDRIRRSGVRIEILDRSARKKYAVEPREFSGRLIHHLPVARTPTGEVYLELYLTDADPKACVGLYRSGTRVLESLSDLDAFSRPPWTGGVLEGIVDAPFLNLTPGTRSGIVQDQAFAEFCTALNPVADKLLGLMAEQRKAEEERASRQILRTIQKAFREAMLSLPPEEYDWFDVRQARTGRPGAGGAEEPGVPIGRPLEPDADTQAPPQKAFFEYAGPLFSVRISPASSVVPVGETRALRAVARDRSHHTVDREVTFFWETIEGQGTLENVGDEIVRFTAPAEPGLTRLRVSVTQGAVRCDAEAIVTVTDTLLEEKPRPGARKEGLPGYTFRRAPGELWRSRYELAPNLVVINSGHRDFVFASRTRALKLRYITRLFAKELVCKNFPGYPAPESLERMIELLLYTEENLR